MHLPAGLADDAIEEVVMEIKQTNCHPPFADT
jgi:hypothetical protein